MSTSDTPPTDPTSGSPGEPQDPTNPTNPYGAPPPPPDPTMPTDPAPQPPAPPAVPPAAPTYGQPPTAPAAPAYGQPPAYGAPAPAYGQQPTYGAPAYGQQPAYGQGVPAYPGGPAQPEPASKGMAIASLILGLLSCSVITGIVSIVLGVLVLRKGKDGRNHGKGLAIAGIILSIIGIIGAALVIALGVFASQYSSVDDLNPGTCVTAKGLSASDDSVSQIKKVSCSSSHDGEVLATHTLTATEAKGYGNDESNQLCFDAVTKANKIAVITDGVNVIGLTQSLDPNSGDKLACVAFNTDGSKLKSKLGG